MTPDADWKRVEELFHAALDREPSERPRFLESATQSTTLRRRVRALLSSHEAPAGFLTPPEAMHPSLAMDALSALLVGRRVGRYRIQGTIARGGMGTVYRAEQDRPRRSVALKVIPPGNLSDPVRRRFELETEFLGRLQHPGIAQVFEAGTAETDLGPCPFIAMELIEGLPLVRHVREHQLDLRRRLELLIAVCEAVQHAHHKGIIHRDLKPGNVLVTSAGQPKILDFGIARATAADLQITSATSELSSILGTLPYASPEQLTGKPEEVDTRSDVYALGVLAYEVVGGRLPHALEGRSIPEAIGELTGGATPPLRSIDASIPVDVETIVQHALERDPDQRYQSSAEMAADFRRFLADEVILARPPRWGERTVRFIRRHRIPAVLTAALGLAIVALAVLAGVHFMEVRRQRDQVTRSYEESAAEAAKATRITHVLLDLLSSADPRHAARPGVTVSEVLETMAARVDEELADHPRLESSVRRVIGKTYHSLGSYEVAGAQLERALILALAQYREEHPDLASALTEYGHLQTTMGSYGEAIYWLGRAVGMWSRLRELEPPPRTGLARDHAEALSHLAKAHHRSGDPVRAESLWRESLALRRSHFQGDHPDVATSLVNLGINLCQQGRRGEGQQLLEEALEIDRRVLGDDHSDVAEIEHSLAWLALEDGDLDRASGLFAHALDVLERRLPADHPVTVKTRDGQAEIHRRRGHLDRAIALLRTNLEARLGRFPADHPECVAAAGRLVEVLRARGADGDPVEAAELGGRFSLDR